MARAASRNVQLFFKEQYRSCFHCDAMQCGIKTQRQRKIDSLIFERILSTRDTRLFEPVWRDYSPELASNVRLIISFRDFDASYSKV